MRDIDTSQIVEAVKKMCIEANCFLNSDVCHALEEAEKNEISPIGREMLRQINENAKIARRENVPICQDTGLAVIFVEFGLVVHITGGSLNVALIVGVRGGF